jgi:hypothetical protein
MTRTRKQLQKISSKNIMTFGHGRNETEKDIFGFYGGSEYYITPKNEIFKLSKIEKNTFVYIGTAK